MLFILAFGVPVLVRAAVFGFRGAIFAEIRAGSRQVERVIAAHPASTVAVGYGSDSFLDLRLSYLRILPVFAGHPLFYDATAMDDLWEGGADRAIALPALDRCDIRVWLIPGSEPFTIRDFYGGSTFPEAFRQLFAARYRLQPAPPGESGPYQVWVCTRPARVRRRRRVYSFLYQGARVMDRSFIRLQSLRTGAMTCVSYTDLRQNLARYMDEAVDSHAPIVVTRQAGRGNVVIVLRGGIRGLAGDCHLLSSPRNVERLLRSIHQIEGWKRARACAAHGEEARDIVSLAGSSFRTRPGKTTSAGPGPIRASSRRSTR